MNSSEDEANETSIGLSLTSITYSLSLIKLDRRMSQIEDYLFLGDFEAMSSKKFIEKFDIKIVLSVIAQKVDNSLKIEGVLYHSLMADDSPNQDLLSNFEDTNRIIGFGQYMKNNVLFHCMAGVSRSSTIVIAYIMSKYKMKYSDAFEFVRQKRPFISPNYGFIRQLELYEDMGFILNPNHKHFRKYLIETLNWMDSDQYFIRRAHLESLRNVNYGRPYLCPTPNCGFLLFNQIHLMRLDSEGSKSCSKLFVEPLDWMQPFLNQAFLDNKSATHSLKCPKCKKAVAIFNENFESFKCICSSHKDLDCLHFEINVKLNAE